MNAIVKVLTQKNPTPAQIQAVMRNAMAVQTGVTDDKTLNDIMGTPAVVDRINNAMQMIQTGTPVKEVLNGIAKAAIDQHASNVQLMMLAQQKAQAVMAAHGGDPNDPGIQLDPGAMKAYSGALKLQSQMPTGYTPPAQRPGATWKNAWGVLPGGAQAPQKGQAPPNMTLQQFKAWKRANGQ